jgi:outer membrane protein
MLKKLVVLCLSAMPLFGFAQSAQVKLGHLDVQTLFLSTPEYAQIDSTMKKASSEYESEINRMRDEYTRKASEYQEGQSKWDETIKQNRMEEIQTLDTRIKNYIQNAQQLLQKKQEDLQAPVREKIKKAIDDVVKEYGFLYVFDTQAIIGKSDAAIDVTPLVLKKLGVSPAAASKNAAANKKVQEANQQK